MMGHKLILNLWHNLCSAKHLPAKYFSARYAAKINAFAVNGSSHPPQLAPVSDQKISDQKELHRRFKYSVLGATVPLSLGLHGLILPIASSWYGSPNSVTSANPRSEVLIDVSVLEPPAAIITPSQAVAAPPNSQQPSDDDSIAALPTSFGLPHGNGGAIPAPSNQSEKTSEPTTSPQAATAGNLAPDNTPPQSDPPKSTPTPPAPSPIASFNPMIDRLLTSNSFSNQQVALPLNIGGGKGTTASLIPSGIGQIGRGLGWGNTGNRNGGFGNSNLSSNNIGAFSGRLGIPFGSPNGRGTGNNSSGNNSGSGSGNSANNGNGNSDQSNGNGRGRIRCQECGKPQYPTSARERGLEGAATVAVDIAPDGTVTNVRILQSSGHPELDEAAINAARSWRFEASATGKQAVPGRMNFQIEGSEYAQSSQQRNQQQRDQKQTDAPPVAAPAPSNGDTPIASQTKPTNPITTPSTAPSNSAVTAPNSVVNNGNATPNLVPNNPSNNIPNPTTPVTENPTAASQPLSQPVTPIPDNPTPTSPQPTPAAIPEA
ncbi:MAG: energy transducer TonB, partial [Pseudanabaena sp. ELA607]